MIDKVFCYNQKDGQSNHMAGTLGKVILVCVIVCIIIGLPIFFIDDFILEEKIMMIELPILAIIMIVAILKITFKGRSKVQNRKQAFATDQNGNVYMVRLLETPAAIPAAGGNIAGAALDGVNSTLGGAARVAGTIAMLNSMENQDKVIQNPQLVIQMIENAKQMQTVQINNIIRVYNLTENQEYLQFNYDSMVMNIDKQLSNNSVRIYKTIGGYETLKNYIYSKNVGNTIEQNS